jgi:hypothetical protein
LSFCWLYFFLGMFCVCCLESKHTMSRDDYVNLQYCYGISMIVLLAIYWPFLCSQSSSKSSRHTEMSGSHWAPPTNFTSLSSYFNVFSKLVVCAIIPRGRHQGFPYAFDRAITLPSDKKNTVMKESQSWKRGRGTATNDQSSTRGDRD